MPGSQTLHPSPSDAEQLVPGGGELGALIRATDWSATALGPMSGWPQSLRTALSMVLASDFPMIVLWGPELTQLYNDKYRLIMGTKHPRGLGQGNRECWPEAWHINREIYPRIFAGETMAFAEACYPLAPYGVVEDFYLTLSYSPVRGEGGAVAGVFVTVFDVTSEVRTRQERDAALEAARFERERLSQLFLQAPAAIAVLEGPEHTFTVANPRYQALIGGRDVVGRPVLEALPEIRGQGFVEVLDEVVATGQPFVAHEARARIDRQGTGQLEDVYVDFVYQPLLRADGTVSGVLVHAVETTGQVLARQRAESLAAEREAILSQIADAVLLVAADGRITFANAAAGAIYPGLELERSFDQQTEHLRLRQLDGTPFAAEELPTARALRGERVIDAEWFVEQSGGRRLRVQGSAVPVLGADGTQVAAALTVRDVTGQRALQQEVELQRNRLADVFSQAPAVIAVMRGPDHVFETANPRFQQIIGVDRPLEGHAMREALPELEGQGFSELLDQVYRTGEPFVGNEILARFDREGKGTIEDGYFNFVYQPLREGDGAIRGILIHAVEVTGQVLARREVERKADELARLTHALELSNRELDQFAYVASHDLKAPLRGIANLAQWIQEDLGDQITEQSVEHMRLLQGRVHRMELLIDGILDYSRAGRVRSRPEPVDTGALIAEVIELLAPEPAVRIEVTTPMPTLETERVPLQQVFLNLVSNAIKYTRPARPDVHVRVSCEPGRDGATFAVADNGPGIAPEYHDRIWTIFQTLQARDKVEGTGIGLSVVKKMVESRGGRVWLESSAGAGATFFFTWPRSSGPTS